MGSQKNCSKVACSPDNMCAVQFVFGVEGVKVKVEQTDHSFLLLVFLKTKTPLVLPCPGTGTAQCTKSTHSFISVLLQMY
jgi:hypothetical protein